MNSDVAASHELDLLLREPAIRLRWPEGLTGDDVLGALSDLGRLQLEAPGEKPCYRCLLMLHETGGGSCWGDGLTLTAAALRCLLEAEAELAAVVAEGLARLELHLRAQDEADAA